MSATIAEGFSAQNVAFGMGGGLLQKVNRDTMSFATKLNYIQYKDGSERDIMKYPKTDKAKVSLPGILRVRRENGLVTVVPRDVNDTTRDNDDLLEVVYDCKPINFKWPDFNTVRMNLKLNWKRSPKKHNVISPSLKAKIDLCIERDSKVGSVKYNEDDFVDGPDVPEVEEDFDLSFSKSPKIKKVKKVL